MTTELIDSATTAFAQYRAGNSSRMEDLVRSLTPVVWHAARATGLDRDSAQDVVQAAWAALVEHADSIRDERTVVAWLVTTTRREAWKVSKAGRRTVPTDPGPGGDLRDADTADVSTPANPEALACLKETQRHLWKHFTTLTPTCQEILRTVAFLDAPNYKALAASLGIAVGSVGPTRMRCLKKLRDQLNADPKWSMR